VPQCGEPTGERLVHALDVQQQTATFTWESPCRCFRFIAHGSINDCGGTPSYGFTLDLSRAAAAGAAAAR
jgi:LPS-assembly protein